MMFEAHCQVLFCSQFERCGHWNMLSGKQYTSFKTSLIGSIAEADQVGCNTFGVNFLTFNPADFMLQVSMLGKSLYKHSVFNTHFSELIVLNLRCH